MQPHDIHDRESILGSGERAPQRDRAFSQPDYEVRPLNPDRVAALAKYSTGTLLDVGCGNGAYVEAATTFAAGLDLTPGARWARSSASFVVGSALQLPFRSGSFDTVCSFETLEHVPEPERAVVELGRVARTRVIVSVPNCEITDGMRQSNLIYHHWIDPTHVNFFDTESLKRLLEAAGLRRAAIVPINRIDGGPFLTEALRLPALCKRLTTRVLRKVGRPYHMTLLGVAEV